MATGWDFTIDDSSSFISYFPSEDSGLGNTTSHGWNPYYSGSGGLLNASSASNYGSWAAGQSLHITSLEGASLAFEFYGSAVCLHGTSNGTYDVSVDGNYVHNVTAINNETLYCQNLPATSDVHYVNLTAHFTPDAGQLLAFDHATVTYDFRGTRSDAVLDVVYNNTDTSAIHYDGEWDLQTIHFAPSITLTAPLHRTSAHGASATLDFIGEAVAVYGLRVWGSWLYNVTLDDELPQQYNGSTIWELTNSLLYFRAGLDPTTTHKIKIAHEGLQNETYYKLYLNTISVFKGLDAGNATSSHQSDKNKAIVGGVLGTVLGLLLVTSLIICLWRRIHKSPPTHDGVAPFMSDDFTVRATPRPGQVSEKRAAAQPAQVSQAHSTATVTLSPSQSGVGIDADGEAMAAREAITPGPTFLPGTGVIAGLASPSGAQPVLVDHIIELIADRIDRRNAGLQGADADEPPRYPDSVV